MNYHFVLCPKYRRKVLIGKIGEKLKELLHEKTVDLGVKIIDLEIMPDHLHIVRAPPTIAPNRLVAAMKGNTSRMLRQEFPDLEYQLPTLSTRSYFVSTYGHVSAVVIKKYVEEQEGT